jgi:hemoglobin-like flavoprotein
MTEALPDLMASYYRCREQEQFFDTFYDLFLTKSPEIARKFSRTDFTVQKLMLRESLLEMLCFARGLSGALAGIERLGQRHKELHITAEMYAMWLDALCEAILQHDPEYTPALEQHWRQAMGKGIAVMVSPDPPADHNGQ